VPFSARALLEKADTIATKFIGDLIGSSTIARPPPLATPTALGAPIPHDEKAEAMLTTRAVEDACTSQAAVTQATVKTALAGRLAQCPSRMPIIPSNRLKLAGRCTLSSLFRYTTPFASLSLWGVAGVEAALAWMEVSTTRPRLLAKKAAALRCAAPEGELAGDLASFPKVRGRDASLVERSADTRLRVAEATGLSCGAIVCDYRTAYVMQG